MYVINKKAKINPENPSIEEPFSDLPSDLIPSILVKLPSKSLLRFKSVCRFWNTLISNPEFAKTHLHQSKKSPNYFFLWKQKHTSRGFHLFRYEDGVIQKEATLEFPLKKYYEYFSTCSCDGLVLLGDGCQSFALWNPASGKYKEFTCPFSCLLYPYISYGFCLNPCNNNYKVILVYERNWYTVYSIENDTWKEREEFNYRLENNDVIFHNGTSYFLVSQIEYGGKKGPRIVVYLDTSESDGEFKELPFPEDSIAKEKVGLVVLKENLCLYRNSPCNMKLDIWMMKEYGKEKLWSGLLTVEDIPVDDDFFAYVSPLYMTSRDEVVLNIDGDGYLVYDPKKKKFGRFRDFYWFTKESETWKNFYPIQCVDSYFFALKESEEGS